MTDTPPEFAEDVRKCAAGQGTVGDYALKGRLEEKPNGFAGFRAGDAQPA